MASKRSKRIWIVVPLVLAAGGVLAYQYWKSAQSALPPGIVSGNGRIEANLTDASAKEPLRVKEVLVNEGDLVKPQQPLLRLDTSTIDAELAKNQAGVAAAREQLIAANAGIATARADVAAARAEIASAKAAIVQEESQIRLAQIEVERESKMLADRATSQRALDVRQTNLETTKATLASAQARAAAAQARAEAAQARADTSQAQADAAKQQIEVALAEVARTKTRIDDAVLISPVAGRVLYRLAEPGEVLGPGGKALTIVDLSDVYMEIFLPAEQAARLKVGTEARITIDSEPNQSAAARVSFVSPEAQFTPKQVETRSEREKLMFRVKLQVPAELVEHYVERIKTGMRGVGYVKVTDDARWPDWLEQGLVNPPKGGATLHTAPVAVSSNASQTSR